MATTPVVRLLVLHGYSQNANIFSKRLGALRKQCGSSVEFVFVDGPIVLHPVDLVGSTSQITSNPQEIFEASEAQTGFTDPKLTPRGWWKMNPERTRAVGLEESLKVLRDILQEQKFHGVFGFSQGAAMAALLSALLERPHLFPPILVDGKPPHPPFEFCVAVSGFKVIDPLASQLFSPPYTTPTLHVLGRTDIIVVEERSQALISVSHNKRIEEHMGGHFVPSTAHWRKFFNEYFRNPAGEIPSPSQLLDAPSGPNSGTSTPNPGLVREYASVPSLKL